jgi:hypothetical protein
MCRYTQAQHLPNGCSNKATVSQNVAPCVGLEKIQSAILGLNLYPNPASKMFTVELAHGNLSSVMLTDITGRIVMHVQADGNRMQLDITTLSNGVYYATITTDSSTEVIRVIKN